MAEIRPFRAWRYTAPDVEPLVSPLFDVVSESQRRYLYQNPSNSIHVSVPQGIEPAQRAADTWALWKQNGVVRQDDHPRVYVYYQYFYLHNDPQQYCRKGFIAMIRVHDYDEKVILRHENTIPQSVADRLKILEATQLHAAPTHGLYQDPDFELEMYMDRAIASPIAQLEDYQGVSDLLAAIEDPTIIQKFVDKIAPQTILLADGHHRYEGSLRYKKAWAERIGDSAAYHMMYLTNAASNDLKILPTHRLIDQLAHFSPEEILTKAATYFQIRPIDAPQDLDQVICGKKWAFGLLFKDQAYKIRLKPEVFDRMTWRFPEVVKQLDLTVLHYFFIEKVLGITAKEQQEANHIQFERNYLSCFSKVESGQAQLALVTNEVSVAEMEQVCKSGFTMPQKSTYFYPKAICGLVFGSIAPADW